MVVIRRHGELARTRTGNGKEVAGRDVAGQVRLGGKHIPGVAVSSDDGHRFRLAGCGMSDPNNGEAAAVRTGQRAVAHVAVYNDAGACAMSHREHALQRYTGPADDGRPASTVRRGTGMPRAAHTCSIALVSRSAKAAFSGP